MPFASKKQARWMFSNEPEMAKRWAAHTKDMKKLPELGEEGPTEPVWEALARRVLGPRRGR